MLGAETVTTREKGQEQERAGGSLSQLPPAQQLSWTRVDSTDTQGEGLGTGLQFPERRGGSPDRTPSLEEPGHLSGGQAETQPQRNKPGHNKQEKVPLCQQDRRSPQADVLKSPNSGPGSLVLVSSLFQCLPCGVPLPSPRGPWSQFPDSRGPCISLLRLSCVRSRQVETPGVTFI